MDLKSIETLFKNAGLEPRQAQFDMMQRISTCLEKKQIIVVEGGTGIGKTYAYLIAALLTKAAKTKIVLATATINLQLQLIEKDIPHIAKLLNLSFKAVLAKGRRRYVCPSRLMHQGSALSQGELAFFNVDSAESRRTKRSKEDESLINDLVQRFENERWEGDRDELEMHVPEDLWQEISTDAPGCSGKRCIYFNDCPYFKAKRRIYGADLIVANHDLLLSDIALGTGALLPDSEQTLYIIDEAHHFPKKTVEHFASNTSLLGSRAWLARIQTLKKRLKTVFSDSAESLKNLEDDVLQLQDALLHMHQYLDPILSGKNDHEPWILSPVPPELSGLAHPIIQYAHRIQNTLYHFRKQLTDQHSEKTLPDFETLLQALGFFITRNHGLIRTWELITQGDPQEKAPCARWISPQTTPQKNIDFVIHAAYTAASRVLPAFFWEKLTQGAVLCSATLRALGQFHDFLHKTGLDSIDTVETAAFESPFDYSRSRLVIPAMDTQPEGEHSAAFVEEVSRKLPVLLEQESAGVLVLFTSRSMMETVFEALPAALKKETLMQNELSKAALIETHKSKVDSGGRSIIFGLQSLAEGIDLPGDYCRHVIIAKLPFSVPSTPIEATHIAWLKDRGKNPFKDHTLPEASIKLTQFAGRLIRHENDVGTLTIFDRRLIDKFYGKSLIKALPKFTVEA